MRKKKTVISANSQPRRISVKANLHTKPVFRIIAPTLSYQSIERSQHQSSALAQTNADPVRQAVERNEPAHVIVDSEPFGIGDPNPKTVIIDQVNTVFFPKDIPVPVEAVSLLLQGTTRLGAGNNGLSLLKASSTEYTLGKCNIKGLNAMATAGWQFLSFLGGTSRLSRAAKARTNVLEVDLSVASVELRALIPASISDVGYSNSKVAE